MPERWPGSGLRKATWASWWAIKAMLALLIAKLVMAHSTSTMPAAPLLPEPVFMLTLEGGFPQAGVRLRRIEAGVRHVRPGVLPQCHH